VASLVVEPDLPDGIRPHLDAAEQLRHESVEANRRAAIEARRASHPSAPTSW
jgi:hypothetical protein